MIDWNKRNGGFLAPENVYEDQLSNLSMQINQLEKQLNKQKEVLDKIKEYIKERTEFGEYDHAYPGILNQDEVRHINRLLEEIE